MNLITLGLGGALLVTLGLLGTSVLTAEPEWHYSVSANDLRYSVAPDDLRYSVSENDLTYQVRSYVEPD